VTVVLIREAEVELEEAFDHYDAILSELGVGLLTQFRRGVDQILRYPRGWQRLDDTYRRYRLRRFPYGIVYRIDSAKQEIAIVCFMHLSRKPGIWRGRE
jgi:mRNA-degrading endonuclease RelE of RelBE toxin-antitoxin system